VSRATATNPSGGVSLPVPLPVRRARGKLARKTESGLGVATLEGSCVRRAFGGFRALFRVGFPATDGGGWLLRGVGASWEAADSAGAGTMGALSCGGLTVEFDEVVVGGGGGGDFDAGLGSGLSESGPGTGSAPGTGAASGSGSGAAVGAGSGASAPPD
jgi:hypothetical protein